MGNPKDGGLKSVREDGTVETKRKPLVWQKK